MKTSLCVRAAWAVLLLSALATGCRHHAKRPPVTTPTSPSSGGNQGSRTTPPTEALDNNGDLRISDGMRSGDIAPDSGEGGPLSDVRFDLDSAALNASAQQLLSAHSRWLKDTHRPAVLEGHCDERGTIEYNLALGEQRARAVYDYLVNLGVPASQMKTVSLGKERPFDPGHSEDAWAKNRRVHFAVESR